MPSPIFDFFDCSSGMQPMGAPVVQAAPQAVYCPPLENCPICGEKPDWLASQYEITGESTSSGGGGGGGGGKRGGQVCPTCQACKDWNSIEAQFPDHEMYASMADNLQDATLAMGCFGGYEIMSVGAAKVANPVMRAAQPPSRPAPKPAPAPAPKPPQMTTMALGEEGNPFTTRMPESGPTPAPTPAPKPTPPNQKVTMAFICSENPAACGQTPPTPAPRPVVDPHNCSCLTGSGQMQSLKGYLSTGDSVFSVF